MRSFFVVALFVVLSVSVMEAKHRQKRGETFQTISEYEKCKQDCKLRRDQGNLDEYVNQLKQELAAAEERLAQQQHNMAMNEGIWEKTKETIKHPIRTAKSAVGAGENEKYENVAV